MVPEHIQNYIKLEDCKERHVYRIHSRNLSVGVFDTTAFIGIRSKFGEEFLFGEFHWDTGPPFGTVRPIEEIGALPNHIQVDDAGSNHDLFQYLKELTADPDAQASEPESEQTPSA